MSELPGLDADDQLAYTISCRTRDCTAQEPGQPCTNPNRKGEPIVQPWAHPLRIHDAKRLQEKP